MAILNEGIVNINEGFKKTIDENSIGLAMDVLQKFQYQYPIKSTIRELTSNAVDSIKERDVAKLILTNQAKVEDYYIERDGDIYKDSRFDPEYYNLRYLSTDNSVYITYHEGNDVQRDSITISDNGVGLGGYRLQKYFTLAWSSKRLNKHSIGKFGLGNKSPLSIMPFYVVESRYNGDLFRFMVYSHDVVSLIPPQNMEGKANKKHIFTDSHGSNEVYSEPTDLMNGVTITIEAKKNHKKEYENAVKTQLTYFDNVHFSIVDSTGNKSTFDHRSKIFYEDDNIILSDNPFYTRPHLLINRVNYGFIDFQELELENKNGNIGIKINPEEVTLNPSRESVVWDELTKNTIINQFKNVIEIATKHIQKELVETDFIAWYKVCASISGRTWNNGVVGRLANVIDIQEVKPVFNIYNESNEVIHSYKYDTNLLLDFVENCRLVKYINLREGASIVKKIDRSDLKGVNLLSSISNCSIYLKKKGEAASNKKDKYLMESNPNGFILMEYSDKYNDYTAALSTYGLKAKALLNNIINSKNVIDYESIEVPDKFTDSEKEEQIEEAKTQEELLSAADRRKLIGAIVVHTPRADASMTSSEIQIWHRGIGYDDNEEIPENYAETLKKNPRKYYTESKEEVLIADIDKWSNEEIYYSTESTWNMSLFAAMITRPRNGLNMAHLETLTHWEDTKVRLFKCSKQVEKYFKDFEHISKFYLKVKNNSITMSNALIRWNTARKIREHLHKLNFLYNFNIIPEKRDSYKKLLGYVQANFRTIDRYNDKMIGITTEAYQDLIGHLEKVENFQWLVRNTSDKEVIKEEALNTWGNATINDAFAVDIDLLSELHQLLDWAAPIQTILNSSYILTGRKNDEHNRPVDLGIIPDALNLPNEYYEAVYNYCESKNCL